MAGPPDLMAFMRTFRVPAGDSPVALLARHDALLNEGGPSVEVHRAVPVDEQDGWRLTVDVHVPPVTPAPVLLYMHGGAWVAGSPATHDRLTREMAARGLLVVSVDYPRAPRRRFPAAYDACLRALAWTCEAAGSFGGDPSMLAVGGDSAGANLAAATAVSEVGRASGIRAAALLYGIYDYTAALPVLATLVGGAEAGTQQYVPEALLPELRDDPRLNPLRAAELLPPSWIGVGSDDPLLAESEVLARELQRLGRPHQLHVAHGAPHSFLQMPFHDGCAPALDSAAAFLHQHVRASCPAAPARSRTLPSTRTRRQL